MTPLLSLQSLQISLRLARFPRQSSFHPLFVLFNFVTHFSSVCYELFLSFQDMKTERKKLCYKLFSLIMSFISRYPTTYERDQLHNPHSEKTGGPEVSLFRSTVFVLCTLHSNATPLKPENSSF